jgi:O-antigen ligase
MMGLGVAVLVTMVFPLAAVLALFVTGILPVVFQMTRYFPADLLAIRWGFNAPDIVLLSMGVAIALEILRTKGKVAKQNSLVLSICIILFSLLLLFEILRNIGTYGRSALGEFRFRYLILVLPAYVSLFFPSAKERKKVFKSVVFLSLSFTLACIPIIGMLKGWSVGPGSRFLPASVSLGLIYGFSAICLGRKYGLLKLSNIYIWIISIPVGILVLVDGHRSVWLVIGVLLLSLIWLKEIRLGKVFLWSVPLILAGITVLIIINFLGLDVGEYVRTRGAAFVNPQEDPTGAWRIAQWKAQMPKFYSSPVLGQGFGGYWGFSGLMDDILISPHSLYVQTLIKIGAVGMLLYLMIVFKVFSALNHWMKTQRKSNNPEIAIVFTAFIILVAAHAFYTVYAFEYYTWLFVGLGVAVVFDRKTIIEISHER